MSRAVLTLGSLLLATACAVASSLTTPTPSRAGIAAARAADFFRADRPVGTRHSLIPSSRTVVYGGYDAEATPVLRIASGDEVELSAVSTRGARLLQPGKETGTVEPAYRPFFPGKSSMTRRNYYEGLAADYSRPGLVPDALKATLLADSARSIAMKESDLPAIDAGNTMERIEQENREWWPTHCEALRQDSGDPLSAESRDNLVYHDEDGALDGPSEQRVRRTPVGADRLHAVTSSSCQIY